MNPVSPLARYVIPVRRWWFVPLVALGVGLLATALTLPDEARTPTAEEIADPETTFRATQLLIQNASTVEPPNFTLVELLARQGELTGRVLDRMEGRVDTSDVDAVELEVDAELGTLAITSTQPTPELAVALVSTYAEELQSVVDARAATSLRDALARGQERLASLAEDTEAVEAEAAALPLEGLDRRLLEAELDVLLADFATTQAEVRLLSEQIRDLRPQFETLQEPAAVPTEGLGGLLALPQAAAARFAILGLFSLVLGVGLVFAIDYLDTRVRTRADAEDAFGLPVIAELPPRSSSLRDRYPLPVVSDATGVTAESFRSLRLSVTLAPTWKLQGSTPTTNGTVGTVTPLDAQGTARVLLVTSSLTGDGKSTTAANLAASFAETGQSVLIVDCDFRRPAIGSLLEVGAGRGLRDIREPSETALKGLVTPTGVPLVSAIRAGSPGIAPAWFLRDVTGFVAIARELADIVILDTGPITLTHEASALVSSVDSVVLVVRSGRPTRSQARGTMEQLTRLGAPMAGIVLVGTHGAKRYGYYAPRAADEQGEKVPSR